MDGRCAVAGGVEHDAFQRLGRAHLTARQAHPHFELAVAVDEVDGHDTIFREQEITWVWIAVKQAVD